MNDDGAMDRARITDEILEEMTAWRPKERASAFRQWVRGSLSLVHLHVLTVLEADGPLAMSKLAEALDVSVASATGIVDRMEDRGLVERRREPDDRRVILVHPTERGNAVFRDLAEQRRGHLRTLLEGMREDELAAFLVGLQGLRRVREATLG